MNRTLITILFAAGCTATVRSAPPAEPMPPPPPPRSEPAPPPPAPMPPPTPVSSPPVQPAPPTTGGDHAAYGDALRDMRFARNLLERRGPGAGDVKWDEHVAIRELDAAIDATVKAHKETGTKASPPPPVDLKIAYRDRLSQAARILQAAAKSLEEGEDNAWARAERNAALQHLRNAEHAVREAIGDTHADASTPPPPAPPAANGHPAYMASITNLRQARALLERPAGAADVKWDEKTAIREIDDALHDIRTARVDDGKPETEHAPIESAMVYRDRLKEAEKQLHEAAQDLEQREDNFWAKKDRKHAIESIRRAEKATHEAMADRKEDAKIRRDDKKPH